MVTKEEIKLLRALAGEYGRLTQDEIQQDAIRRMRATNDLQIVRPPVLMDEIPWFEFDQCQELALQCTDEPARSMEQYFRRAIYRRKHFACDSLMTPYYPVAKAFTSTGNGLGTKENTRVTDARNNIISHEYLDVLPDEAALEKMHLPVVTVYPEKDAENLAQVQEILGDTLEARLQGQGIYYAPWDVIPRLHGVQNCFVDMVERPEFMHKVIQAFTEQGKALYDQYEALGLLDANIPSLHCTPSYITGCPEKEGTPTPHKKKDLWFRSMAQMFTSVSPKMHWEFDLQYSLPMMKEYAFTYYGCCEALDNKIDMLKKIPNLRKLGVSPWADPEVCAQQMGGIYVASRKPNPALVATTADPAAIAAETEETVKACQKYGTPLEFILKDISTVGCKAENLEIWSKTVTDVLKRYY